MKFSAQCKFPWLWPLLCLLSLILSTARSEDYVGTDPYQPKENLYRPELLIVGGSSSGTAAALTAGRLGINTVWTVRAPRDLGGLSTNAINPDSDLAIRYIGGLALEYDVVARVTTGYHIGGRHNGEGYFAPFHILFDYTRKEVDKLESLTVLSNLYPVKVEKDPTTKKILRVIFRHRLEPDRTIIVEPKITIDAEIEGDVAHLAGVEMTLRREGKTASDDPTRDNESYAGKIYTAERKVGTFLISGGPPMKESTFAADQQPATMAYNGSVTIQDFKQGTPVSPWILKKQPAGYDPEDFKWWNGNVQGVTLGADHRRWNMDEFLSTVEGWRLADGRHVLESMNIKDREANEKAHFQQVICALWHLQHHFKQYRYGLSKFDFREGLAAKYMLSDFGTTTNEGDQPLPSLIYMREGRRMVNDHVFGGKLIEDDGSGRYIQKRYWHPRAAYFNCMLVDIHGVHLGTVPGSGPEGMQLLRLAGYHNFGAPCIPFDVFLPRPSEATGLLVSSAGAYTHQAYSAFPRMETGRIAQGHACAIAAYHCLKDGVPPHEIDVRKVQISNLRQHGQSIVYLDDTLPGTQSHLVDQMLAARRVPERNDQDIYQHEAYLTTKQAKTYLQRLFQEYTERPVRDETSSSALAHLKSGDDVLVSRVKILQALSRLAEFPASANAAEAPFADVPAESELAAVLQPWIKRKWILAGSKHAFRPDEPMPFREFKQHAYHALFGEVAPETVRAVDYRPLLASDTFNRPDGELKSLASGQKVLGGSIFKIQNGQLLPSGSGSTSLLIDAGQTDFDVSADVFLERNGGRTRAGILFRAADFASLHVFLLESSERKTFLRIETSPIHKQKKKIIELPSDVGLGYTLRVVALGNKFTYFLNDKQVYEQTCTDYANATLVGLYSDGELANRLDNFEVQAVE